MNNSSAVFFRVHKNVMEEPQLCYRDKITSHKSDLEIRGNKPRASLKSLLPLVRDCGWRQAIRNLTFRWYKFPGVYRFTKTRPVARLGAGINYQVNGRSHWCHSVSFSTTKNSSYWLLFFYMRSNSIDHCAWHSIYFPSKLYPSFDLNR